MKFPKNRDKTTYYLINLSKRYVGIHSAQKNYLEKIRNQVKHSCHYKRRYIESRNRWKIQKKYKTSRKSSSRQQLIVLKCFKEIHTTRTRDTVGFVKDRKDKEFDLFLKYVNMIDQRDPEKEKKVRIFLIQSG